MPKTNRQIAREVNEILAGGTDLSRHRAGEEAYNNIQAEARMASAEAGMADNAQTVPSQRSPRSAHALVAASAQHADQTVRLVKMAESWVRKAQGTPQFAAVERVLRTVQSSAARAKARASATRRAFEKKFGKYHPRGVTDQNNRRAV